MSKGLRFRKVDLHVHTPASRCFEGEATADEIVRAVLDLGLDALAVTDHNGCSWIRRVQAAAQATSLTVFPGVEITSSEGIHLIALLDTDKTEEDVNNLLGALAIPTEDQGRPDALSTWNASKVAEVVSSRGALVILAHIDQPKGAFTVLQGVPRKKLFNEAPYDAVETETAVLPAGLDRDHGFTRNPACYQASDNPDSLNPSRHSVAGIGRRYAFFKLGPQINLEGLRQCFTDPEVRIRSMAVPEDSPYPRIVSIKASDGFLMNQTIEFQGGLNSIIGSKGTGKSLIVEFVRFALDQTSTDPDILRDHTDKLAQQLGQGNLVEAEIQLATGSRYRTKRTVGGALECVEVSTGAAYAGSVKELFPILAYSQTEVIGISRSERAQLDLLDGFLDIPGHRQKVSSVRSRLTKNARSLADSVNAGEEVAALSRDLATTRAQLREIDRSLAASAVDPLLTATYRLVIRKSEAVAKHQQVLVDLKGAVGDAISEIASLELPDVPEEFLHDALVEAVARAVSASLEDTRAKLVSGKEAVEQAISQMCVQVDNWSKGSDQVRQEYSEALQEEGGRAEEESRRQELDLRLEETNARLEERTNRTSQRSSLESERSQLLDELDGEYDRFHALRGGLYQRLANASNGRLKLELIEGADRSEFAEALKSFTEGTRARKTDLENVSQTLRPREFVRLVMSNDQAGLERAGLTETIAEAVLHRAHSLPSLEGLLELELAHQQDVPRILFRRESGDYAPLSELSVGQKCTALLLIALAEGSRPVLVDQPEDALDITTVWEDIAQTLRRGKDHRQFVVTTHNPTVAAASDSDVFIVLSGSARRARVTCTGPIDTPEVKEAVIKHLEGGRVPYSLRSRKYRLGT